MNTQKTLLATAALIVVFGVVLWAWSSIPDSKAAPSNTSIKSNDSAPSRKHTNDLSPKVSAVVTNPTKSVASVASKNISNRVTKTLDDELATLSPQHREIVLAVNKRFFGLLDYQSPEERVWKEQRLFPTPQQIVEWSKLPAPVQLTVTMLNEKPLTEQVEYFARLALTTPSGDSEKSAEAYVYIASLAKYNLQSQLDTPLVSYFAVGLIDPKHISAEKLLAEHALNAGLNGDPTLAEAIAKTFKDESKQLAETSGLVLSVLMSQARLQSSYCEPNRYTGNPRSEQQARQLAVDRPCSKR